MGLTVRDCLHLPSLREAKVVAGHKGLDQYVTAVSVLEYAKVFAMADDLFLGNELIISAFTSVMDDVEAQCVAVKRLHEVGEVGLILYYVGYCLKSIDKRLIDTANNLDFPLIVMPENAYNLRYNEVITEVLERIFDDRKKEQRFVPLLLRQIANMRERQRNISGILRLLSDRLRYSFLLLDQSGREHGLATWPMSLSEEYVNAFRDCADNTQASFPFCFTLHEKKFEICRCVFDAEQYQGLRLYAMAERDALDAELLEQAVEVLQTSYSLWRENLQKEEADDLIRIILNSQQERDAYRIAGSFRIDLKALRIMWVLRPRSILPDISRETVAAQKQLVKQYLYDNRKTAIVDAFDKGVVAFMNDDKHLEVDEELANEFEESISERYPDELLIWCGGLDSILDSRKAYMLMEEYCSTACVIYPYKKIFTLRELSFAETCHHVVYNNAAMKEKYLSDLKPLYGHSDETDMLHTLTVYLVDANQNTSKAAALLHIHESTVKYRLNKIGRRLGYDIVKMPAAFNLYLSLSIKRLTDYYANQNDA